jgi:hypothetical protein
VVAQGQTKVSEQRLGAWQFLLSSRQLSLEQASNAQGLLHKKFSSSGFSFSFLCFSGIGSVSQSVSEQGRAKPISGIITPASLMGGRIHTTRVDRIVTVGGAVIVTSG